LVNKFFRNLCMILVIAVLLSSCAKQPTVAPIDNNESPADQAGEQTGLDITGDLKTLTLSHNGYNLTPDDSEKLFEVGRDFVFTNIRDFSNGKPDLLSFSYYVETIFDSKYSHWDEDRECTYVKASDLNDVAQQYFGFKYDIPDGDIIELPNGESQGPSIIDFVRYDVENLGSEKKVTVVGRTINAFNLDMAGSQEEQEKREIPKDVLNGYSDDSKEIMTVVNYMKEHNLTNVFDAVKEIIVIGKGDTLYGKEGVAVKVTYLSDDGYTPKKFLSFESYKDGWTE